MAKATVSKATVSIEPSASVYKLETELMDKKDALNLIYRVAYANQEQYSDLVDILEAAGYDFFDV